MGRARRGTCVIAFHPQRVKATALAADVGTGFPSLHTDVQLSHKVINVNTFLMSGNCTVLLNSFGILVIKNCVLEFPGAAVGQGSGFVTAVAPEAGGSLTSRLGFTTQELSDQAECLGFLCLSSSPCESQHCCYRIGSDRCEDEMSEYMGSTLQCRPLCSGL